MPEVLFRIALLLFYATTAPANRPVCWSGIVSRRVPRGAAARYRWPTIRSIFNRGSVLALRAAFSPQASSLASCLPYSMEQGHAMRLTDSAEQGKTLKPWFRNETLTMKTRSTTILSVRHQGVVALGGDGQVSLGNTVIKADAMKIRRLMDNKVITGFAGSAADAFALLERFEAKLRDFPSNVPRAATELAKDWRTDRVLRRLEALLAVVDARHTLLVTGNGDVIQPTDGVLGIGSGGNFAVAAARALIAHSSLDAATIVRRSLEIAAGIDVFTNENIVVEVLPCAT